MMPNPPHESDPFTLKCQHCLHTGTPMHCCFQWSNEWSIVNNKHAHVVVRSMIEVCNLLFGLFVSKRHSNWGVMSLLNHYLYYSDMVSLHDSWWIAVLQEWQARGQWLTKVVQLPLGSHQSIWQNAIQCPWNITCPLELPRVHHKHAPSMP